MKKIKFIFFSIATILVIGLMSCEKEIEVEYNDAYPVAGTWWVTYQFDDGAGNIGDWYGVGYTKLFIYNTSFDKDSVWIDDHDNFWQFKVQVPYSGSTFSVENGDDIRWGDSTSVRSGQVVNNDSIYMEIEWASDSGTIYQCSGVRYDGFGE
jgi:hypothetical protein